ncbi:low molecular weight protein arginine phosphatase [Staphylococcus pasteuri]|uniref:Low molecular weight protein-tyrosine-phosphatase PtpB n=2 Tax=Staphylococcus TaxID=1279 RepID=A0ABY1H9M0_9STAP|nr:MULTISPECIES: low molecular weight protein arginine phosphatase [Staphylococcus]ATH62156.1 protein tyrosine phosphatase [Staphylococcus pasteuri]KKI56488.1 Low molecular weight protein tyrosine phosphatase [Staphylococcus pasteuri]MCF7600713.1 low molecular weight protein arginine phosphatase [Staphylococcus pasteuri]MDI3233045.1 low molecular weight protein arginine phosphatase [Staphylococcus pasteuri]MDO6574654.1 low molecular weight protein arginine phosphatase [Staphylococcus pasteuri_
MKLIFVCTGNTCRSPMAESIAQSVFNKLDITIESRGIFAMEQQPISKLSEEILTENDLPQPSLTQSFSREDIDANIILTMSKSHKDIILSQYGTDALPNVFTLSEFVGEVDDIYDPYGGDKFTYQQTFNQIYDLIMKIDPKVLLENYI